MFNNRGVSLIEAIIASSVGIVIIMALGELMMSQQNATRDVMQTYELATAYAQVTEHLSDNTTCGNNFNGIDPNIGNINNTTFYRLLDRTGAVEIYREGNLHGGGLLTLTALDRLPASPPTVANSKGMFILRMTFQRRGLATGLVDMPIDVPVFFNTDGANNVASCSTQGVSSALNCVRPALTCNGCPLLQTPCPPSYTLTGGGISDQDTSKRAFYSHPIAPGTPGFPDGGWRCQNADPGFLECTAICCR
ncbi:MAG: hypothetical protein AABZ31_13135 [Bdellovibrionota bacterium]